MSIKYFWILMLLGTLRETIVTDQSELVVSTVLRFNVKTLYTSFNVKTETNS